MNEAPLPVICLAGPTGSGKTAVAVAIARELDCGIINADSRQVYADFPIITAQPDQEERGGIEHYLYGYLPSREKTSAGQWARLAAEKAREIIAGGKIPLFVGGTGLYFHSLLRGLANIPAVDAAITRDLERRMREEGQDALYAELKKIDPDYCARIHPHDRQRILRALEVPLATGKTFSWWHAHSTPASLCAGPFFVLDAALDPLVPRLRARIWQMLETGAAAEAEKAWNICPDWKAPGWSGIGCRECLALARQEISEDDCAAVWLANTRAYAKRQITWFKPIKQAIRVKPESACETIIRHYKKSIL